ncbi:MAG TPA: HNH endonuclease [Blastocatellia bacterium]|nr:HNH endonuclease [Blastocatellia bacterium]
MSRTRVPSEVRERVRAAAAYRCGYCLSQQRYVLGIMEIEHIIPLAGGGTDEEENLWLSCGLCNRYKGTQTSHIDPETGETVSLFNPRLQKWSDHFCWDATGTRVVGLSPTGRATVIAMKFNNPIAVEVRTGRVLANWHPPEDIP